VSVNSRAPCSLPDPPHGFQGRHST
jgi:hypothetical protein